MKLSETLRRCAGHYIVDNQMADEAEALEARLEAYEHLQRLTQKAMDALAADNKYLREAYQRATRFNPED